MNAPLEIVDPGAPGVDASLCRTIAAMPDAGRALVLGTAEDAARLQAEGLDVLGHVPVGGEVPRLRTRRLARRLSEIGDGSRLRTWSEPALAATLPLVRDGRSLEAIVAAVSARPPFVEPWHRRGAAVRPIGLDLGPRLARRGWRVGSAIRLPEVPIDRLPVGDRSRIDRDRDAFVIAVPVEPFDAIDPWTLVGASASAAVAGRSLVLVLRRQGADWTEIGRWFRGMVPASAGVRLRVVVDERAADPRMMAGEVDVAVVPVRAARIGDTSLVTARAWLASGVPVIGPAVRGFGTLVEDGVDGRLVRPGDRNALARAILRLADDPSRREDMAHAAAARHGGHRSTGIAFEAWSAQDAGTAARNPSAASR